jgi:[acyl-carrier-protein] S-malonyltransferase
VAVAFTFPGQGSQRPGMGAPWVGSSGWSLVEEAGTETADLLLHADADALRAPYAAQVATYLTSLVVLSAVRADPELSVTQPVALAGHSLGEYSALAAGGALRAEEGLALVAERGRAMADAAADTPGAMAAVLGAGAGAVDALCAAIRADGLSVWPANDNGEGHIVVSGTPEGVAAVADRAEEAGARRVLPIPVGGAYHTPLMAPARERLEQALARVAFADTALPVVSNVEAQPHTDGGGWPARLSRQLTSPVRWRETLHVLAGMGVDVFVEIGPGSVLTGLARRAAPGSQAVSVAVPDDLPTLRDVLASAAR